MQQNYQILLSKIDEFTRKFYLNQLIRGGIYAAGLLIAFFLLVNILEYFGHFDSAMRKALWFLFLGLNVYVLFRFVIVPLSKLYKLGNTLSHEEAALIIGKHFSTVEDKILNILQLQQNNTSQADISLIQAAIDQKALELKPVPFSGAINLKDNRKYLKYAFVPLLILVSIFIYSPALLTNSTRRLVNYNEHFEPEAPFRFVVENKDLQALQHEDFLLNVKLTGNEIPEKVTIHTGEYEYQLEKADVINFNYTFNNLQSNTSFYLIADGFKSKEYTIEVVKKPGVLGFELALDYPAYTGRSKENLDNAGDISVPAGTKVRWRFKTENTSDMALKFKYDDGRDTAFIAQRESENEFSYKATLFKNFQYNVINKNGNSSAKNELNYTVNVTQDAYPVITVNEQKDSLSNKRIYFAGQVKDDYGFASLSFNYRFVKSIDTTSSSINKDAKYKRVPIAFDKSSVQSNYYHYWDLNSLNITLGDEIEYFFEVYDNDAVNGNKPARTQSQLYKAPTLNELAENTDKNNKEIKDELQSAISKAKKIQKDMSSLNKKMLEKKNIGWEEKKQMEELLKEQKELQKQVEQIKQDNAQNNQQQNEFVQQNEELVEKQKQLDELFDKVMTDEMKEMFKEMEKMLEKFNKDQAQDMLDKMKLDTKDLAKELDRNLELFKQLEFEQKLNQNIDKLNDLAMKQEELSKETQEDKKGSAEEKLKKQEELNKEFDNVKKDLNDLDKLNKELETPNDLKNTEKQQEDIKKDQEQSSQDLKSGKQQKASKSQKSAADKMKDLAQQMEKMSEEMQEEAASEDYDALRQILENLLQLSFDQEGLMASAKKTDINNPQYLKIAQQQKKLKDDAKMIEDSLFALSKRQPKIESVVNQEISAINDNIEKTLKHLEDRQTGQATSRQQFTMTAINNLALILSESLQNMQEQMKQSSKSKSGGKSSCKKPGSGQPSMSSLRQMQKELAEQMKKMKESGQKPGDGKKPGKPGEGQPGMSKEFAKMAAQQEALRQALQQAMQSGGSGQGSSKDGKSGKEGKDGKESGGVNGNAKELREIAKKMEQTETDLVNKTITNETLKRQQDILTRLLEAENAEREREQDEKRKSNESKNENLSNPEQFLEYKRLKAREAEMLKTVPPALKPFYKNKVNEYFNSVSQYAN